MARPQRLGNYRLVTRLALGGMGELFLARQLGPRGFERTVALKRILPHLAEDPAFVDLFLNEARLAARLAHPNIVPIIELGEHDGAYFLTMEYVHGRSLRAVVDGLRAAGRTMPADVATAIAVGALAGLDHAHRLLGDDGRPMTVIHRDVSPENVLVGFEGAVKLVDFGVAKAAAVSAERTGTRRGKLSYMAPEQIEGDPVDARTDVYALGVVLYELLAGKAPFVRPTEPRLVLAIRDEAPEPLTAARSDLPAPLLAVIDRALAKKPADRFDGAAEMALALRAAHAGALPNDDAIGAFMRGLFGAAEAEALPGMQPTGRATKATLALPLARPRLRWALAAGAIALAAGSVALAVRSRGTGTAQAVELCNGRDDDGNGVVDDVRGCLFTLAGGGPPGFRDGAGRQARFARPAFLAVASDGALLVADRDNHALRRVDPESGAVTTLAGNGRCGFRDGPVAKAELCEPFDLEPAPDGTLYFTDRRNHRVRALQDGRIRTIAGTGSPGAGGLVDGAALGQASFNEPSGLLRLPNGDLLIADRASNRVRRYVHASATVVTEAGAGPGQAQGTRLSAVLGAPVDVAVDRAGTLYVSERNGNRIRKLPLSGPGVILAGSPSGRAGDHDAAGESALLSAPGQIVLDEANGWLFVATEGNNRLWAVPLDGGPTRTLAGARSYGYRNGPAAQALFLAPLGLVRAGNRFFVGDGNHVVRAITLGGTDGSALESAQVADLAGGHESEITVDGPAGQAHLRRARGLVRAGDGTLLWVETDTSTLRRLRSDGRVETLVGGGEGYVNGPLGQARLARPADAALGRDGRLYIADEDNAAIRVVDLASGRIDTCAGPGPTDGAAARGFADGPLAAARFRNPRALAVGRNASGAEMIYVADGSNFVVRAIDLGRGVVSTLAGTVGVRGTADGPPGQGQLASGRGLAAGAPGEIYISDGSRLRHAAPDGTLRTVMTVPLDPEAIALDGDRQIAVGDRSVIAVTLGQAPRVEVLFEAQRGWRDGAVGDAATSILTSVVVTPTAFIFTDAGGGRIRRLWR